MAKSFALAALATNEATERAYKSTEWIIMAKTTKTKKSTTSTNATCWCSFDGEDNEIHLCGKQINHDGNHECIIHSMKMISKK